MLRAVEEQTRLAHQQRMAELAPRSEAVPDDPEPYDDGWEHDQLR